MNSSQKLFCDNIQFFLFVARDTQVGFTPKTAHPMLGLTQSDFLNTAVLLKQSDPKQ